MAPIVEQITEVGYCTLGEGPHWDVETQSLYFVDIKENTIHKYVPATKKHTSVVLDNSVSFVIPVKGSTDRFVISSQRDVCVITWDGVSTKPSKIEKIAEVDTAPEEAINVLNDGKVDAFGNLWTGTMQANLSMEDEFKKTGNVYSVSKKVVKKQVPHVTVSNGLAWSVDSKKFYYIDSTDRTVDEFDYDHNTFIVSNRKTLFSFDKHGISGLPDGQTIDSEGNLWVAVFQGNRVLKISTKKPETLLDTIIFPDSLITSACFGGENLDELYVTSSSLKHFQKDPKDFIKGALYRVTGIDAKGLPSEKFSL